MDNKKEKHLENKTNSNIDNYYSSIDKNTLDSFCSNENLRNLIYLSTKTDINVFNKKYKKWQLKNKDTLLKECEQVKKKELKNSSNLLSNLAKLNENNDIITVRNICSTLEDKMTHINELIGCINNIDSTQIEKPKLLTSDNFSDSLSNKQNINIVSFDPVTKLNNDKKFKITIENINNNKIGNILENKSSNLINLSNLNKLNTDSSDSYIECYSNC